MSTLPTRTQLEEMLEFVATFAGSSYKDDKRDIEQNNHPPLHPVLVKLRLRDVDGPTGLVGKTVARVPDRALAQDREVWLRTHWEDIIEGMLESGLAVDDQMPNTESCPRADAHGGHWWGDPDLYCEGIKAHANTAIGGAHSGMEAAYGQIDVGALTGGSE